MTDNKRKYVLGFMFDKNKENVLLIHKNRPENLAGKINGIGGKIENFTKINNSFNLDLPETPLTAMIREFEEECGIKNNNWTQFCKLIGENCIIYIFKSIGDITLAKTIEDEEVVIYSVKNLPKNSLHHINWLIPMALTDHNFIVNEIYLDEI